MSAVVHECVLNEETGSWTIKDIYRCDSSVHCKIEHKAIVAMLDAMDLDSENCASIKDEGSKMVNGGVSIYYVLKKRS